MGLAGTERLVVGQVPDLQFAARIQGAVEGAGRQPPAVGGVGQAEHSARVAEQRARPLTSGNVPHMDDPV